MRGGDAGVFFFIVAHVGQIQTRVFDDMFFKVRRIRLNGQKDE